jgi:hypothetical protein
MTVRGVVKGSIVILEDGTDLPEGTPVEVRALSEEEIRGPTPQQRQAALKRLLAMNLPVADWSDMEAEIIRGACEGLP